MTIDFIRGKNLLVAIRHISDEAYQRRAWFGHGPEVSSPSEIYNEFFDECQVDQFIADPPTYVSASTVTELANLRNEMDLLDIEDDEATALFESSSWSKIRKRARIAGDNLERDLKAT